MNGVDPSGSILRGIRRAIMGILAVTVLALILSSMLAWAQSWETLGPFGATVGALAISSTDPNVVYVAAQSSGIFRSTDGGGHWSRTGFSGTGNIYGMIVDPNVSNTLYVAASSGFYVSEDAGETWETRTSGMAATYVNTIAVDPTDSDTIYAGGWGGISKTTTAGESWVEIGTGLGDINVAALAIDPENPEVVYAGTTDRGVLRSENGGQSWTNIWSGIDDVLIRDLMLDPTHPKTVYVATNSAGVYRSNDGGGTWEPVNEGLRGGAFRLAMDPRTSSTLYLGTQGRGMFRSVDGGDTWESWSDGLPSGASEYAIEVRPDTGEVLVGLFSLGVYRRTLAGSQWSEANVDLTGYIASSIVIDRMTNELLIGIETYGPTVFRSADQGSTWTRSGSGMHYPVVYDMVQDLDDPNLFLSANSGSIFRSNDGGRSWSASDSGLDRGRISAYGLLIDRGDPSVVFAAISSGIWSSSDSGQSWMLRQATSGAMRALAQSPSDARRLLAGGTRGLVYRSTNGGTSWLLSNDGLPAGTSVRAICFDPAHPATVYAGTDGNGIFRSDDGGTTWSAFVTASEFSRTCALLPINGSTLLAGTRRAVYQIDPTSGVWQTAGNVFEDDVQFDLLLYDSNTNLLYAGGAGGLYRIDWTP